jgi:hypothetical protein
MSLLIITQGYGSASAQPLDPIDFSHYTARTPADVIRALLVELRLAVLPRDWREGGDYWPAYASQEPNQPDEVITVYDTAGILQGRIQLSGDTVEQSGIQIRVRANTRQAGYDKVKAIELAFATAVYKATLMLGDSTYTIHSLTQRSSILELGRDPNNSDRYLFTVNYTVSLSSQ